jgi:hypothetical protein
MLGEPWGVVKVDGNGLRLAEEVLETFEAGGRGGLAGELEVAEIGFEAFLGNEDERREVVKVNRNWRE